MAVTTSLRETTPSSVPSIQSPENGMPHQRKRTRKGHWLLHRLANEWSSFVSKLKDLSEPHSPSEDDIESMFESSDEEYFGRGSGKYGTLSPIEYEFLSNYKKHRTLEKLYQAHMASDKPVASKTVYSRTSPQELLPKADLPVERSNLKSKPKPESCGGESFLPEICSLDYPELGPLLAEKSPSLIAAKVNPSILMDDEIRRTGSTTNGAISDFNSTNQASYELPATPTPINVDLAMDEPTHLDTEALAQLDMEAPTRLDMEASVSVVKPPTRRRSTCNLGEKLWEERRNRWLETSLTTPEQILSRQAELSLSHVNVKLHAQIYTMFVEKSKSLKNGKRINLEDLVTVINAGWTKEAKWERAAKGLP